MTPTVPNEYISCVVVDAGARYGLHPTWSPASTLCDFFLFEVDNDEVERLKAKYSAFDNIRVLNTALFDEETTVVINLRRHLGLSSLYEANDEFLRQDKYWIEEHTTVGTCNVDATTLDSFFEHSPVHFLKLDTEGSEVNILRGAEQHLQSSVLGVRSEVQFAQILQGTPLFGEIHQLMLSYGFELLNFDYSGRGAPQSPFTRNDRYGKLMSTDAVWVLRPSILLERPSEDFPHDIIRLSLFLMLNNATDYALKLLVDSVRSGQLNMSSLSSDPIFRYIKQEIRLLFKEISYYPSIDLETLDSIYKMLFDEEFPKLHHFYQAS
jgi:FkbM family methyltransferase